MQEHAPPEKRAPLTILTAKRIITMDESLPAATAVGVIGDRIVAVGDVESMSAWKQGRAVTVDDRLRDKVLLPGFIDNHVHPFLGALLLPSEIIAPEDWRRPDGGVARASTTPEDYRRRVADWVAARRGKDEWLISWGYQPSVHGRLRRPELDAIAPGVPLVLWQRSFHEMFVNTAALEQLGVTRDTVAGDPQVDWEGGHFYENGSRILMARLMPWMLRPQWYHRGLGMLARLMLEGGLTTIGDQLFGAIDVDFELAAIASEIESPRLPLRIVNVADGRTFSNRASGAMLGPPDQPIAFDKGVAAVEELLSRGTRQVRFARAVKLFADGAMFSQLMRLGEPGYTDGHQGEWLMSPEVLAAGVRAFWRAGFQIHVHVNGDGGMDAVLAALEAAQREVPRFDHRFTAHHLGFHTTAQTRRLAALGAVASVNPYYIHALADSYAASGLGDDRAAQIVRAGSLVRAGIAVSFHSDFPMAPTEPLFLAWCAATRQTRGGKVVAQPERLGLEQALRGVTIDAAFALGMDHEIGSVVAGKKADFTVLEEDPFTTGIDRLKDIAVWGTVFEGEVNQLARPVASVHAAARAFAPEVSGSASCCAAVRDRCDFARELAAWLGEALSGLRPRLA